MKVAKLALLAMAGVALLTSGIQAAPILNWTVETNVGTSACDTDLSRFTLHAMADEGQKIVAIDAEDSATNVGGGIYADGDGPLYQIWLFNGGLPTPVDPTVGGAADALDTHFIAPTSNPTVNSASEDNDLSCGSGIGWGQSLTGLVGWTGTEASDEADVLQVVVPTGHTFYAKVQVADDAGQVTEFAGTVPEPTTLLLLGLGGVGALLRRRRRA